MEFFENSKRIKFTADSCSFLAVGLLTVNNNELSGTLPSEICGINSLSQIRLFGGFPNDVLSCGDCEKCF